jgi:hypothetical protein
MTNEANSSSYAVIKEIPIFKVLLVTLKELLNFSRGRQFLKTMLKEIGSKLKNCRSRE